MKLSGVPASAAALGALEDRAIREAPAPLDSAPLAGRLSGPGRLERALQRVLRARRLCEWAAARGQGASVSDVELATAGYLAGADVVALGEEDLGCFGRMRA